MMFFSFLTSLRQNGKKSSLLLLLAFTAIVFLISSILTFSQLVQHQDKMMLAAEEDALWASYQLDKELLKFQESLQTLDKNYTETQLTDTQFRFEILLSRLNILDSGKLKILLSRSPKLIGMLKTIRNKMNAIDLILFKDLSKTKLIFSLGETELLIEKMDSFILEALSVTAMVKDDSRQASLELLFYVGGLIVLLTITVLFIIYLLFKQLKIVRQSYMESHRLTKELEKSVALAEKSLQIKSDFMAAMSHEIRTPMNAIIGFSHLLLSSDIEQKSKDKVDKIQTSAQKLLSLVNGILDFSELEAGEIELKECVYSLDEVLADVYQHYAPLAHEKGLSLHIIRDFSINDALIGDRSKFQEILVRLIGNAVKFTHTGGIKVSVCFSDEKKLLIKIKDTGVGVDDSVNVFGIFQQADNSTTRPYGGAGLGLSITQKFVKLMNGNIVLESLKDEGSTLWVTLPYRPEKNIPENIGKKKITVFQEDVMLSTFLGVLNTAYFTSYPIAEIFKADYPILVGHQWLKNTSCVSSIVKDFLDRRAVFFNEDRVGDDEIGVTGLITPTNIHKQHKHKVLMSIASNEGRSSFSRFGGYKVLLAEDNKINADLVKAIIEKIGLTIDVVENGLEAYEKTDANSYDLIIMDIRMPIMDGYESSQKIHEKLKEKRPPILVLTADTLSINKDEELDSYFDDVMFKPLEPYLFIEKVTSLILENNVT